MSCHELFWIEMESSVQLLFALSRQQVHLKNSKQLWVWNKFSGSLKTLDSSWMEIVLIVAGLQWNRPDIVIAVKLLTFFCSFHESTKSKCSVLMDPLSIEPEDMRPLQDWSETHHSHSQTQNLPNNTQPSTQLYKKDKSPTTNKQNMSFNDSVAVYYF